MTQDFETNFEQYFKNGRITFTEIFPINMIIAFIFQILWSQMLDNSFLPMNSFIAISIPGIPKIIQAVMIKYIYFDIFYTELWID
jgi:hypothetical protein